MTALAISCMLLFVGSDLAAETALCDGFNSGDGASEPVLVATLRPLIRADVKRNWKGLWRHLADLEQGVFVRLWSDRADGAKLRPPLAERVKGFVDTVARKLRRERAVPLARDDEAQVEPSQEQSVILIELLALAAKLPAELRMTLLVHARSVLEGGPALHQVLGIDERAAQKRLARAQAAMETLRAAREEASRV